MLRLKRVQREQVLICRAQAASHVYNAKIHTYIYATKQNPSTRLVKNESFKKKRFDYLRIRIL